MGWDNLKGLFKIRQLIVFLTLLKKYQSHTNHKNEKDKKPCGCYCANTKRKEKKRKENKKKTTKRGTYWALEN